MSRTYHHQFSTPDPYRVVLKMERKARPAGRLKAVVDKALIDDSDLADDLAVAA